MVIAPVWGLYFLPFIALTGLKIYICKKRANVNVFPEILFVKGRKELFYIKKKIQSDYIISSQDSRIGFLQDLIWSYKTYYGLNSPDTLVHSSLSLFVCKCEMQCMN